jgi:hypothetical protein
MSELVISKAQMLEAVDEIFRGKRSKQSLRRVLHSIYFRHSIEEGRRQADRGQTIPHEKVMEAMWRQINTGLSGRRKRNSSPGRSSRKH